MLEFLSNAKKELENIEFSDKRIIELEDGKIISDRIKQKKNNKKLLH